MLKENVGNLDELFVFTDPVSSFNIPALSRLLTIVALCNTYHTL